MANIPRKFIKNILTFTVEQVDDGYGLITETLVDRTIRGAVFPLNGKEQELMLSGVIKSGTLKLYTNERLDTNKLIRVNWLGSIYNLKQCKGDFVTDTLNTYYLELRE